MKTNTLAKTKKQKKEDAKRLRVCVPFNTGERIHKSPRDYKRVKRWAESDE